MIEIFEFTRNILELDTTILIYGETGTGKELLANSIHFIVVEEISLLLR